MSHPSPRVSICIPVYNGEHFLRESIESALAQSFGDYELIVLDNASTDSSVEIAESFSDARMRILHSPVNLGAAANWNRAIEAASGEFMKLLCADDILEPECIARQVDCMDAEPSAVLCSCSRNVIDEAGTRVMRRGWGGKRTGFVDGDAALRAIVRTGANLLGDPSAVLIRRSALNEVGGFEAAAGYAIDLDMWSRLLMRGGVVILGETLSNYRVSATSWSVASTGRQASDTHRVLREIAAVMSPWVRRVDGPLGLSRARLNQWLRALLYLVLSRRTRMLPSEQSVGAQR